MAHKMQQDTLRNLFGSDSIRDYDAPMPDPQTEQGLTQLLGQSDAQLGQGGQAQASDWNITEFGVIQDTNDPDSVYFIGKVSAGSQAGT